MPPTSRSSSGVTRAVEDGSMHDGLSRAIPAIGDADVWADRSQLAVARTMPVPFAGAVAAAVGLTRPPCAIDRRWRRDTTGPFNRSDLASARSRGRVHTGRRVVPVEIELAPWADGVTELVIRPDVRAPHRWSGRRRRGWYAAVHPAADALRQQIVAAQPATSRSCPAPPTREIAVSRHRLAG